MAKYYIRTEKNKYNISIIHQVTTDENEADSRYTSINRSTAPTTGSYWYNNQVIPLDDSKYDSIIAPLIEAAEKPAADARLVARQEADAALAAAISLPDDAAAAPSPVAETTDDTTPFGDFDPPSSLAEGKDPGHASMQDVPTESSVTKHHDFAVSQVDVPENPVIANDANVGITSTISNYKGLRIQLGHLDTSIAAWEAGPSGVTTFTSGKWKDWEEYSFDPPMRFSDGVEQDTVKLMPSLLPYSKQVDHLKTLRSNVKSTIDTMAIYLREMGKL
tara:strand:- start:773 stop:1600 length:828 start_codon:yes stop_codon:yes gene_type:complete